MPHEDLKTTPPTSADDGVATGARGGFQAAKEGWLKLLASYPNLSGADYAVAIVIASHLNSVKREAWPSMATISALANRRPSTVWRAITKLKRLSLLGVKKGRGRHNFNIYSPLLGEMEIDPATLRGRNKKTAASN